MRCTLLALLAPSLVSAQGWSDWGKCSDATVVESMGEQVHATQDEQLRAQTHQIVTISTETGLLEVNQEAELWKLLKQEVEPINLLVFYGTNGGGTSTLASMVSCAISPDEAVPFNVSGDVSANSALTEGIWASPILTRTHAGVTKKYVVIDLMNFCGGSCTYRSLAPRVREDSVAKVVSMFTELASVFIFNSAGLIVDTNSLQFAFGTTRSALLPPETEEGEVAPPRIASRNNPYLYVTTRVAQNALQDDSEKTELRFDEQTYTDEAQITESQPGIQELLKQNFQNHTNGARLVINPVPVMSEPETTMSWANQGNVPFPAQEENSETTGACGRFNEMISARWECQTEDHPSAPRMYRFMVENLIDDIHDQTTPREINLNNNGIQAHENITGFRLQAILEASVQEINTAGPVPDNQLWRIIMLERCETDMEILVNRTVGRRPGGVLRFIEEDYLISEAQILQIGRASSREFEWTSLKTRITNYFTNGYENQWTTRREKFFTDQPLLEAVRDTCEARGLELANTYRLIYERMLLEVENQIVEAQNDALEEENARLQAELNAAYNRLQDEWWDENLYYVIALGVCGVILLILFLSIFGQICLTTRACFSCCDDLKTTDHDARAIILNSGHAPAGGVAPGGGVRIGGPVRLQDSMEGPTDSELMGRIEELEVVLQQVRRAKGAP